MTSPARVFSRLLAEVAVFPGLASVAWFALTSDWLNALFAFVNDNSLIAYSIYYDQLCKKYLPSYFVVFDKIEVYFGIFCLVSSFPSFILASVQPPTG